MERADITWTALHDGMMNIADCHVAPFLACTYRIEVQEHIVCQQLLERIDCVNCSESLICTMARSRNVGLGDPMLRCPFSSAHQQLEWKVSLVEKRKHPKRADVERRAEKMQKECRFCGSNTVPPEIALNAGLEVNFSLALSQVS